MINLTIVKDYGAYTLLRDKYGQTFLKWGNEKPVKVFPDETVRTLSPSVEAIDVKEFLKDFTPKVKISSLSNVMLDTMVRNKIQNGGYRSIM